jgi:ribose-phosphate pyrophosphokinase
MILFYTHSSQHLAEHIAAHLGACTIKHFSDGELFLRLDEDVRSQEVWVLASTQAPAENLMELFFLLNALQQAGARIHLFITYFAYARQVVALPGEAHSAQIISSFLNLFALERIVILHAHTALLHNFLSYEDVYDEAFFNNIAQDYDAIVAPDHGAFTWASKIAQACKKEIIILTKTRPEHEQVTITAVEGNVYGKRLLIIDDIISTGRTVVEAAHALKAMGAAQIAAAATHGIFSPGAYEFLENNILESITVTNSVVQQSGGKIQVKDISRFIAQTMNKI